jgi:imidazolonepropionase
MGAAKSARPPILPSATLRTGGHQRGVVSCEASASQPPMPVLTDIASLATCGGHGGQDEVLAISGGALVWEGDTIRWVGREAHLPDEYAELSRESAGGRLVIPGLVDCHTHLAFGGWRADEFEQRIRGASYLEIARAGGGIASTMRQTRAATQNELVHRAAGFLTEMRKLGVTTVEAKSGYGLSEHDELTTLRAYSDLRQRQPTRMVATFLGAHIVPPEYRERRPEYLRMLCEVLIPRIEEEGLARYCDVFVEETAYTPAEARALLLTARRHALGAKLHVDQLSDGGGAALAAEVGAVSADHLEYASQEGIDAMARAGTVAVALPLATLYLHVDPMPARRFVEAGVAVAVATDFNPGSAPSYDLPLAMLLACTMLRMTPAEALKGATRYAARAVGMEEVVGSLEPGKKADFAVIDAPDINHWLYHFRPNACVRTVIGGETVWEARGE